MTKIIAHRGSSFLAPENTLAAIRMAYESGAIGCEIDIRLSADGQIMVIHDGNALRTSGVDMEISRSDSTSLRKLDVGTHKEPEFAREKIPFLEETLELIPLGRQMLIEIKCGCEIVPYLEKIVEKSGKAHQLEFISFNAEVLELCRAKMPHIRCYYLVGAEKEARSGKFHPFNGGLIEQCLDLGFAGLDLDYHGVDENIINESHDCGLEVYVWTVDGVEDAKRLSRFGAGAITTNRPENMIGLQDQNLT